jgi:hypothetical protein
MPEKQASGPTIREMITNCQEFRELIDSYLSGELLVETNHEVLRHLENCALCRNELAVRRELRMRLRSAVKNSAEMQIDPLFVRRLQSSLRETALRSTAWEKRKYAGLFNAKIWALTVACLLVAAFFLAVWLRLSEPTRETARPETNLPDLISESPIPTESPLLAAIHIAWREIAHAAIGDHRDCALDFRLREKPITLEQAAERFGKFNKDLDKTVIAAINESPVENPADKIEFLEAHSCIFQGRRFAHVVLRYRNHLVSILVTNTDLPDENIDVIAIQSEGIMKAAVFSVAHHAVFVVSDLTEAENSAIARIVSPSVRRHIEQSQA